MRTITTKVYTFNELEDTAKEKARDWYRAGMFDYEWYDYVFEDAKRLGALMGWNIDKIYFSGFSSQGDGACFEGSWSSENVKPGGVKIEAPRDKRLHAIATEFERLALSGLSCTVKQSGHYNHEGCTDFSIDVPETVDDSKVEELKDALKENSRDFMRWIYRRLEAEYEYMSEDAQVDENITVNEYEFKADGTRA